MVGMFPLLFLVLFFLLGSHRERGAFADEKNDNDELILVQALWRHGDRSPITTFKTDIYQEEHWPQGWGQLSPRGMAQHVRLGKQLKERYVYALKFLKNKYNSHEVYVRSTDFNRTLISAISNLIGFYGPGGDDDYPKELGNDWPGWYVPIPIHTVAGEEDYIAPGDPQCPRQDELRKLLQKAPEYTKAQAEYKSLLDFLREKTGEKMADRFACWTIAEAFMIEKLNGRKLVDWAEGNETLYKEVKECEHLSQRWLNGLGLSKVDGFDFRMEIPKIRGGPILWKLIANMQDKLRCERSMNMPMGADPELAAKKSPFGAPMCQWMNRLRYYVFSAHDSTIAALFSALGFEQTNYDKGGLPPYSACVTVEMWRKMNGGGHYLKVLYWRPEADGSVRNVEITKGIEGCSATGCTLEQFIARSKPYEMLPSAKEYCHKPLKPGPDPVTPKPPAPKPPKSGALGNGGFGLNWAIMMAAAIIAFLIKL